MKSIFSYLYNIKSWAKILIGLVLGIIVGYILGPEAKVFEVVGQIFINMLMMLVPLIIFSSLIVGICHINDPKKLGRIGFRTIAFYITTTIIAVILGIIFAYIIKPGAGLSLIAPDVLASTAKELTFNERLLSIVPDNPFSAFAKGDILQIIIFAIFLAIAIIFTKEKSKPLLTFLESVANTMHTLTHFVMMLAPYGVFALMASTIGSIGIDALRNLFWFLICNYIACFIQLFFVFGICIKGIAKLRVVPFFKGMKDAIVLAFTTSSSAATLPVSLECAQKHLGISENISGFVLSLGSTINMNGASVGQAVSAIFIAQAYGIDLSIMQLVTLVIVSLLTAMGAAGVPGTGYFMLPIVLGAIGLPIEGMALVVGVDRLREMVSAVVNIMGDAAASVVIAKKEGELDEDVYNHATWTASDI